MYKISTNDKKSVIERNFYTKSEKIFYIETGYRWGSFNTNEKLDLSTYDPDDGIMIYNYDVENHDLDDGYYVNFHYDNNITVEEREEIEESYNNNWYTGIEDLGWSEEENEVWFFGPLNVEKVTEEEEDFAPWDGTTRSHVIEDDD